MARSTWLRDNQLNREVVVVAKNKVDSDGKDNKYLTVLFVILLAY
jgi:hypothetical protein